MPLSTSYKNFFLKNAHLLGEVIFNYSRLISGPDSNFTNLTTHTIARNRYTIKKIKIDILLHSYIELTTLGIVVNFNVIAFSLKKIGSINERRSRTTTV